MNTDNLTFSNRLAANVEAAGGTVNRDPDGRVNALILANGKAIGWRMPEGLDPDQSNSLAHSAARVVALANAAAKEAKRIAADPDLSDTKKAEDTRVAFNRAEAEIASLRETAAADLVQFTAHEKVQLSPPRPTGDELHRAEGHVGRFIGLHRDEQMQMVAEMRDGKHLTVLAALADTDWPLAPGIAQTVAHAWSEHLQRTKPELVQQLAARRSHMEWLGQVAGQTEAAVHVEPTLDQQRAVSEPTRVA